MIYTEQVISYCRRHPKPFPKFTHHADMIPIQIRQHFTLEVTYQGVMKGTIQYESLAYLFNRCLANGTLCGDWWKEACMVICPAYILLDLYSDGFVDNQFVPYDEA
jgi:hypothetical protein